MKLLETLMGKSFEDLFVKKEIDEQMLGSMSLSLDYLIREAQGIGNYQIAVAAQNLQDIIEKHNTMDEDETNLRNKESEQETFEPLSDTPKEPW